VKIVALIPAKNEEEIIGVCLQSLQKVVDHVVVYDDNSTDKTSEIARQAGAVVINESYSSESGWPEFKIRERLLEEARKLKATHIISIDADEALAPTFAKVAKEYFQKMKPGDTLSLRWITLWKRADFERVDGIYASLYKEFAFCDDLVSKHEYAYLGVGRVPKNLNGENIKVESDLGGILHFQYVFWEQTQLKQAWYRCSEFVQKERSAKRINNTYRTSLDSNQVKIKPLPAEWIVPCEKPEKKLKEQWYKERIFELFDRHGVGYFEPLEIWHVKVLNDFFTHRLNRSPKVAVYSNFTIFVIKMRRALLNTLKK
jgi:glycosyltransferase involved in cell wall biosynthesis